MQTDMPTSPRSSLSRTARHSRPAWVQKPMPEVERPPKEVMGDSHESDGGDSSVGGDSSGGDGGGCGGDGGSGCGCATDVPMSPSVFCQPSAPLFTQRQVSSFSNRRGGGGGNGGDGGSGCSFATDVTMSPSAFCVSPAPLFTPEQAKS